MERDKYSGIIDKDRIAAQMGHEIEIAERIFIVTGAAQGFGYGIAAALAAMGAKVCMADMNVQGVRDAERLLLRDADAEVISVGVDVSDEDSVRGMILETVKRFGGLDVLISCAGILKAGGLPDMSIEDFERITAVNYTGFFLCSKHASEVMKEQRMFDPERMHDIIMINSKSGLEGSKANFAYAGSKFGGIGLVQSYALELAEYGIKVNAICPGNYLDGPLWSDPEKGLFRQYLDAGKAPGAKTLADVRAFYESKVPLGRGCRVDDVVRAIKYVIDQKYETGQAVPVTGGQVMMR